MTVNAAYQTQICSQIVHESGQGHAIAQFGELFQGVARDDEGKLHRCLVSLPCDKLSSTAKFNSAASGDLLVTPASKQKAQKAARIALEYLGSPVQSGTLIVESNIPEGKGMGSSTADCIASIMAVAAVLERRPEPQQVAEIVVKAETASGNVMFNQPVLFAHREGRVLENYFRSVPTMLVLGFDTEGDKIVETLLFPPAVYSAKEIEQFRVLRAALRRAILTHDARLLGSVATASAEINQKFLPKPLFAEICHSLREVTVLGVAVAHSGTVSSILLDAQDPQCNAKVDLILSRLESFGIQNILQFRT